MDQDSLHMDFLASNVDFIRLTFDLLGSRSSPYGGLKFGYSFKTYYYFYCTLYTDFPGGSADAVARHVSFS